MAMQIERKFDHEFASKRGLVQHSDKWLRKERNRRERRRAKKDPECLPEYKRYDGWEW